MARPRKQTVDYFPHSITTNSRTLFILETKYGNDGYAFWFKLLEVLGSTNGHCFNTTEHTDLLFLSARVKMDEAKVVEILDLLASLEAIDKCLWSEHRIIWCQNFVDNLGTLYDKRKVSAPIKPIFCDAKEFPERKPEQSGVSGVGNPQSKVKESKGKYSKEDESRENTELTSKLSNHYENCFRKMVVPIHLDKLQSFIGDGIELELLLGVMEYSASKEDPWSYCIKVLNNNLTNKILTLKDFETNLKNRQTKQDASNKKLVSKNPQFTTTYSHGWDLDKLDELAQEYMERTLYGPTEGDGNG